jgi:hypothetical protein
MIDLKQETAKRLEKKLDISSDATFILFEIGLVDERTAKRFLVKDDFECNFPKKGEKEEAILYLADKYCISFETARNYISGRYK